MTLLRIEGVTRKFGGILAISNVSLAIEHGQVFALIGPNGAGKTTLFNVITGVYAPTGGRVTFADIEISGRRPHDICRLGIARTFQNIRLFSGMTVTENVLVGRHSRMKATLLDALLGRPRHHRESTEAFEKARSLLSFVGLGNLDRANAASLPYGHQRRLEIARALATEPKLLLLDEPAAGLTAPEKAELKELVRAIGGLGITVLLIEHDMRFVMGISDRIAVLDYGEKIAEGTPAEIRSNTEVINAYLGSSAEETG